MFETSILPIYNQEFLDTILDQYLADGGVPFLDGPSIYLFTAGPSPIPNSFVLADFTIASFAGYATQTATFFAGSNINLPSGLGRGILASVLFTAGSVVAPGQTILGYLVDIDGSGANLVCAEYFPNPISISAPGDFIDLTVTLPQIRAQQVQ